ncbi:MAG: GNAT family N-acetyltransferase [Chitinophagales bacterium]
MKGNTNIRYVQRKDLESGRWDDCVQAAPNGMIYAYSFYLDKMARHWDALILGDYEFIMPLVWNRKWGLRYLYQPPFTQQLGIFSRQFISSETVDQFLETLTLHFRFAEINLNHGNPESNRMSKRANYILNLNRSYEEISKEYKQDLHKNLRHAAQFDLNYSDRFDLRYALGTFKETYQERTPQIKSNHYRRFELLCSELISREMILLRSVTIHDEDILATAILLKNRNRFYLIQSTVTTSGRTKGANHFLLDRIIREFAGQELILDFEGSDIPGIAHFYKNFASMDEPYFFYRLNQLPWPFKHLKNDSF